MSADPIVLIVNTSWSVCGACGKETLPSWTSHKRVTGYGANGEPGCGAVWTHVSSDYTGMDDAVKAVRPDLPFLSWDESREWVKRP